MCHLLLNIDKTKGNLLTFNRRGYRPNVVDQVHNSGADC